MSQIKKSRTASHSDIEKLIQNISNQAMSLCLALMILAQIGTSYFNNRL